ncbi:glycosyltransferase [Pseudodesulfovibrio cashew]|uniref:Glycosyltransferase n=1 Tax=Pseudodesulfovibrio cashew TaxID=2678688 RepID=A0A6I6JD79_9BACT|nr:glycosyltransferase family 2 protein [Pseudodesulfovibrio cashew]QGY39020.1 glycosyltransferase [Pseudodesulfovibrio cashew]
MDISVLVCTWNNCRLLRRTLDSILANDTTAGFEIVVVNNNSTDETASILQSYEGHKNVVTVLEPRQGVSYAKNAGLQHCNGRLIVLTDDDVVVPPHWLEEYWKAFSQDESAQRFWGGPIESEFETHDFDRELLNYAPGSVKGLDLGTQQKSIDRKNLFLGANWALSKEACLAMGGFNNNLGQNPSLTYPRIGEESELIERLMRAGYEGIYLPTIKILHFVPETKLTLKHICDRRRALGHYKAIHSGAAYPGRKVFGIPTWLYKKYVFHVAAKYLARPFSRKEYIRHAARLSHIVGEMHGLASKGQS